jgi:hypothetical protein
MHHLDLNQQIPKPTAQSPFDETSFSDVWFRWELLLVVEDHVNSVFVSFHSATHLRCQSFYFDHM